MKGICVFLITVALITCMPGCYTPFPRQYELTISSTPGGTVTDPGEGIFAYYYGTVVSLNATPDAGYQFACWTGDVGTVGNADASETIVTTNGDYEITANFELIANIPPIINSLTTDGDCILPSESLNVTCNASDPDGDELSYEWSSSGGGITGMGPEVVWTAPQEVGTYNITVLVRDGYGGSDTRTVCVTVPLDESPTIEALLVTAEHCYLKVSSGGYWVAKERIYSIECIVSDTGSELSYVWLSDGGNISGEGSVITWTAPDTPGQVIVTVAVSCIDSCTASESVTLSAASCTGCTFPGCTD